MFRLLQIDPDSLAIHINYSAISASPHSEYLLSLLDALANFPTPDVLEHFPSRARSVNQYAAGVEFASSYIHELRHYADLALTPYGFYRLRAAFESYSVVPHLFTEGQPPLIIPLPVNRDAINRLAFSLPTLNGSHAEIFLRSIYTRYNLIHNGNRVPGWYPSGDNILEALAFIAQFEFLLNEHNHDSVAERMSDFFRPIEFPRGSPLDLTYRWFVPFVRQLHSNDPLPNNRLISGILFASLCGAIPITAKARLASEILADPNHVTIQKDVSDSLPENRFLRLFEYFLANDSAQAADYDEAFERTNQACKQLFGRTIEQEISTDLAQAEATLELLEGNSSGWWHGRPVADAFRDVLQLRISLFAHLKARPSNFLSSHEFAFETSRTLRPPLVYWVPQGVPREAELPFASKSRSQWIAVADQDISKNSYSGSTHNESSFCYAYWSPVRGENGYSKGLDEVQVDAQQGKIMDNRLLGRQYLYAFFSPLIKYLNYGLGTQGICEFQVANVWRVLGLQRPNDILDPSFHRVYGIQGAGGLARFLETAGLVCDICNAEVHHDDGLLQSPLTIRQSEKVRAHYDGGDATLKAFLFEVDWSDWFVCKSCLLAFDLPREVPKAPPDRGVPGYSGLKLEGMELDEMEFQKKFDKLFGARKQ